MEFRQFYLGCLAHASYYVGSAGEAVIIDPQRDVQQYLDEAAAHGQDIKYIIETHSHADFVSGHLELAEKTGAQIIYGQKAQTQFPTLKVKDNDELTVGTVKLKFRETPGHTPEGITILAGDVANPEAPAKLFTGDTLFIGDVGRPDLIGSQGFTAEQMGALLYNSLHEKILPLPDETEVYPAHGAGSLCGKSLSKETWSTLGQQKKTNYALQQMSQAEFVQIVAADQVQVPAYFSQSAAKNLQGSPTLEDLPKPKSLTTAEINQFDGIVLDVRSNAEFGSGHIPQAINIGLEGQFASWAGTVIATGVPLALAANTLPQIDEAFMRLARVGYESVTGFILMENYHDPLAVTPQISVAALKESLSANESLQLVDVRRVAEYAGAHAPQTINLPLDTLKHEIGKLDPTKPTFVICQSGYRSSIGTSLLEKAGFEEVHNVTGGTKAWMDAGYETETSAASCANP